MDIKRFRFAGLLAANVIVWCMLSLYQQSGAAPRAGKPPFANSVQQRQEMIRELNEIKSLLKEQNALLRAAQNPDKKGAP